MVSGTERAMRYDFYIQRQLLYRVLGFPCGIPVFIGASICTQQRYARRSCTKRLDFIGVLCPQLALDIVILGVDDINAQFAYLLVEQVFLPLLGKISPYVNTMISHFLLNNYCLR